VSTRELHGLVIDALADTNATFTGEGRATLKALLSNGRTYQLPVRLTLAERQQVKANAEQAGQTVSQYVREKIL
jgi:hypothetical protein